MNKAELRDEMARQLADYERSGKSITRLQAQPIPKGRRILQSNTAAKFREVPMTFREWYDTRGPEWLIEQYALWTNLPHDLQLDYGKQAAFVVCMSSGTVNLPRIDSDILDFMQGSITAIPREKEQDALRAYYIKRKPYDWIAKRQGCSPSTARNRVMSAVDFIDGRISMYLEMKPRSRT